MIFTQRYVDTYGTSCTCLFLSARLLSFDLFQLIPSDCCRTNTLHEALQVVNNVVDNVLEENLVEKVTPEQTLNSAFNLGISSAQLICVVFFKIKL